MTERYGGGKLEGKKFLSALKVQVTINEWGTMFAADSGASCPQNLSKLLIFSSSDSSPKKRRSPEQYRINSN